MTNPICGHGRDVLIWALRLAEAMPRTAQTSFRPPDPTPEELARMHAVDDVHDPGKLAAMMAGELQRFGYSLPPPPRNNQPEPECPNCGFRVNGFAPHGFKPRIDIEWRLPSGRGSRVLFIPAARNIFLQWLQLSDGAHEEALRVLQGAS